MSQSGIESRLDKLLEKVSGGITGGEHVSAPQDREVARVVKRTEVASISQKKNLVKYIVIGVAIIMLLAGIIYFVAKTKYGKGIRDVIGSFLPGKKKRNITELSRAGGDGPSSKLVAQEVDFRSKQHALHRGQHPHGQHGPPPVRPRVTVQVPRIPPPTREEEADGEALDPNAVRFRRRKGPVGGGPVGGPSLRAPRPQGPPPPVDDVPMDDTPMAQGRGPGGRKPRGPSPPVDDVGPPIIVDSNGYDND